MLYSSSESTTNPGDYRLVRLMFVPGKAMEQFFLEVVRFDPSLSSWLALPPPKICPNLNDSVILWNVLIQGFSKSTTEHMAQDGLAQSLCTFIYTT